nr:MAG TPA: putative transcriptional regulator [Caudoviricetes sp.]
MNKIFNGVIMPIINKGYLTGLEIKTIREELGLTQAELMRLMKVKNYRTIQRWEYEEGRAPTGACDEIVELLKTAYVEITGTVESLVAKYKRWEYADFALILYPEDVKRNAAVRKVYCRFIAEGKKAHMVRFDEEDYNNYLAAQNLSDCEKNRDAWALYYWKKAKA